MTDAPVVFAAILLLVAGVVPAVAARFPARLFEFLPPIVLSYAASTLLAMAGCWRSSPGIDAVRSAILGHLLPALVFLMLVRCDLRAVAALGPRVLLAAACSTVSILAGIVVAWLAWRPLLPAEGWQVFAALGATWVGGTANLVAVSRALDAEADTVSLALVTDTVGYTIWVLMLFASVPLASRFNRWAGAADSAAAVAVPRAAAGRLVPGGVLAWLGGGMLVGAAAAALADRLPAFGVITATSWTLLIVTAAGCLAGLTPLARMPGADAISSALLSLVVVTMASQASLEGLEQAPAFVAAGLTILAVHAALLVLAARVLKLDLALCGIASLANVGGVGSAPVLAAAHAQSLAPVGVLLGLLGYVVGTPAGLALAAFLPRLGGGG
ncbi:MAG: DUF819 domain-containing protein [Planctomycetaceae bacterium]